MRANAIKVLLLAIALIAITVAFIRFNRVTLPDGPVPVVWDSEVCTHCKMHVGDPRFAAQIQTKAGDVLNFDDPGCLFDYADREEISVHAIYFRNHQGDGWLSQDQVGFMSVEDSPMGYGIRAVSKGMDGANGIDWAKEQVRNRRHQQHGEP